MTPSPAGDDDAEPPGLSPSAAFGLLGNETRVSILETLWDAQAGGETPIPFSALFDRVEYGDSGNFNYHLDRLVGHFVRRGEGGYELRSAGEHVVRAVLAGAITSDPSFEPTEIDANCPYCGGTVEAWYGDETFTARCTVCPGAVGDDDQYPQGTFLRYEVPPAALRGRTPAEMLAAAHVLYDAKLTAFLEGVCPECGAVADRTMDVCPDHETVDGDACETCGSRHEVWVDAVCRNCRYSRRFVAWFAVATTPAVVSFFHEHGAPWNRVPFAKLTWENAHYVDAISESVASSDPLRVRITIDLEDVLEVVLDEELAVVDVTRRDASRRPGREADGSGDATRRE
jgi:hypothetical protein